MQTYSERAEENLYNLQLNWMTVYIVCSFPCMSDLDLVAISNKDN